MCNHNDASRTPVTARNSPSPHACVFASSCMAELTLEAMVRDDGKPLPGVLNSFTAPISPICRTPLFPISHILFILRPASLASPVAKGFSCRSQLVNPERPPPPRYTPPLPPPTPPIMPAVSLPLGIP